jgi:hypothetical protein
MSGSQQGGTIGRRELIGLLAAAGLAGCTPARILLQAYPEPFKQDDELNERILSAFADAIIPGAGEHDRNVVRVYRDEFYPFAKYHRYFASDLCRRAGDVCGTEEFGRLSRRERERVIEAALASDGTSRKLYSGAIMLTQVAFYGGIYDDQRGCAEIAFDGEYRFRGLEAVTYPDPERFLATPMTPSGHPH